jgi:arylsulfatase A-like enzyme
MMRNRSKVDWLKGSFLLIAAALCSTAFAADSRPNILWIFSDDHAVQAIGAYGGRLQPENLTPNLDRIAAGGMVFERAYVANSICGPSRATLLTGKHSHKNGKLSNQSQNFNHDQQQFQKILQTAGYQTAMIGKIHLAGAPQGFDHWEILPGQGRYINPEFITEKGTVVHEGHSTDVITDRALRWFGEDRDPDKPFMLMVHFKAPHRTWLPAERFREAFKDRTFPEPETLFDDYTGRGTAAHEQDMSIEKTMTIGGDLKVGNFADRTAEFEAAQLEGADLVRWKYQAYMRDYLACIAGVDENIGRLLDALKAAGLDQNTIVMYSADQGFYLGEHGWFDKRFMYEESFRTPLIARWPGVTAPGARNRDLVQNIDFAETFLDLAGAPIPADMDGQSIVPLLKGERPADWRTSLYYHYYEYPGVHSVHRHEGVATDRYKLIRFYGMDVPDGEEWEFYDLKTDPQEMQSVYNHPEMSGIVEQMKEELARLRTQYEVPENILAFAPQKAPAASKRPAAKNGILYHADPARPVYEKGINVKDRPLNITARVQAGPAAHGVILAQGGQNFGYALYMENGRPGFVVRQGRRLIKTEAAESIPAGEVTLTVELTAKSAVLSANGREVAAGEGGVLHQNPSEGLSIGYDFVREPTKLSCVGEWDGENRFSGTIESVEIK